MILDNIFLNIYDIYLCVSLFFIFVRKDSYIYYLLIVDILFNNIPFISIVIIILYLLRVRIFRVIRNNFINEYIVLLIFYFIFGMIVYLIYNDFSLYIIKYLIKNFWINAIVYYFGLKYLNDKYNELGDL